MKYAVSMARTYVQDARAEAAASKRLQVLDAAIEMLASEPLPRVTLEAVARRAGAARSTVYVMFGSRAGLFDAVARRLLERIGFDRLVAAVAAPDPLEALRQAMHESVRLYAEQRDAARALWSWADLDTDAAGAFAVLDGGRAAGTAHLVGRLAAAGKATSGRQSRRGRRRALRAHVVRHLRPAVHRAPADAGHGRAPPSTAPRIDRVGLIPTCLGRSCRPPVRTHRRRLASCCKGRPSDRSPPA